MMQQLWKAIYGRPSVPPARECDANGEEQVGMVEYLGVPSSTWSALGGLNAGSVIKGQQTPPHKQRTQLTLAHAPFRQVMSLLRSGVYVVGV